MYGSRKGLYFKYGTMIACGIGVIVCIVSMILGFTGMQRDISKYTAEAAKLEADLQAAKETEAVPEQEAVEVNLNSAKMAGTVVSDIQNEYLALFAQSAKGAIEEDAMYARMKELREELVKYLDEDSAIQWYLGDPTQVAATWSFGTNYDFTEKTVPVIWMCYDDDNTILAFVTGTYDAETKMFSDVQRHATLVGNSYIGVTGEPQSELTDAEVEESVNNIFDLAGSIDTGEDTAMSDEEWEAYKEAMDQNARARAELRDLMMGGED